MSPDVAKTLLEQIKDGVKPTEALANIVSQQNTLHPDNEMKPKPKNDEAMENTVQNEMKPR